MSRRTGLPRTPNAARTRRTNRSPVRPTDGAIHVSMAVAAAAIMVGLIDPAVLDQHQLVILGVGFVVGLPHGAVDHLVGFWTGHLRWSLPTMSVVLGVYLALALAAWLVLRLGGPWTLAVFLLVSVLHFGAGDVMADARRPAGRLRLVVAAVARGGPVVAGPLLAWPVETTARLQTLQPGLAAASPGVRLSVGAVVGACLVITAVADWRTASERSTQILQVAELVLLALLFVLVPPLAAFGIYFGLWHGLRHTARLIQADGRNAKTLAAGRLGPAVRRFLAAAAGPSLIALAATVALVLLAVSRHQLVSTVFVVLLSLTVPHLVAVGLLDARRGAPRPPQA